MVRDATDRAAAPSYRVLWMALLRRDTRKADAVVEQALRQWPAHRLNARLFEPALALSGPFYLAGRITHHDEHAITWGISRLMRRVRRLFVPQEPTGPLALAVVVGQQYHRIGMQMVCDALQRANWRIHWSSASDRGVVLPLARRLRPAAVLFSVSLTPTLAQAQRLVAALRRDGYPGLIAAGGRAVNADAARAADLGVDLTAANPDQFLRLLKARMHTRRFAPDALRPVLC